MKKEYIKPSFSEVTIEAAEICAVSYDNQDRLQRIDKFEDDDYYDYDEDEIDVY